MSQPKSYPQPAPRVDRYTDFCILRIVPGHPGWMTPFNLQDWRSRNREFWEAVTRAPLTGQLPKKVRRNIPRPKTREGGATPRTSITAALRASFALGEPTHGRSGAATRAGLAKPPGTSGPPAKGLGAPRAASGGPPPLPRCLRFPLRQAPRPSEGLRVPQEG